VKQVVEGNELASAKADVGEAFASAGLAVDAGLEVRRRAADAQELGGLLDGQEWGEIMGEGSHKVLLSANYQGWQLQS